MAFDWRSAASFGLTGGIIGGRNKDHRNKYEENRRRAMEAYQREMYGLGDQLAADYAPNAAEQGNVVRRYGVAGQVGGPSQLFQELDPEVAKLYRQRVLEELGTPDLRYQESVGDLMKQLGEYSGGQAIGRGVFRSGLHAQDYAKRGLQTMVPFRMQAITNALNRGENFTKVLEMMRAQAVGEYEPVRQREVMGKEKSAQYKAAGLGQRYGTEADIAEGNVNRYLGREAAMTQFLGQIPGMIGTAATGVPMSTGSQGGYGSYNMNPEEIMDYEAGEQYGRSGALRAYQQQARERAGTIAVR